MVISDGFLAIVLILPLRDTRFTLAHGLIDECSMQCQEQLACASNSTNTPLLLVSSSDFEIKILSSIEAMR